MCSPLRSQLLDPVNVPRGPGLTLIKVIGEAQGDEAALSKLIKDINHGPPAAHVVKVEKSDIDTKEGETSFED